jgi:hypothetical protein
VCEGNLRPLVWRHFACVACSPPHTPFLLNSALFPRSLTTLVVFSILLAGLLMLSTCLPPFTSCHLTVTNRPFPHRLIGNTPIVNRPYTTIKGSVQASCGAWQGRGIGRWGILKIGCHTLLRHPIFPLR